MKENITFVAIMVLLVLIVTYELLILTQFAQ